MRYHCGILSRRFARVLFMSLEGHHPHISENRWRTQSAVAESVSPRHRGNTSALKSDETEILVWGPKPHWTSLPQLSQLIWLMRPLKLSYFVITHQGARTDPVILFDISIKNSDDTPLGKLAQFGICVSVGQIDRVNGSFCMSSLSFSLNDHKRNMTDLITYSELVFDKAGHPEHKVNLNR